MKYLVALPLVLAWGQGPSVPGVFDLGGPRSDGSIVVAGSAQLYSMGPDGTMTHFATASDAGAEAYLAVASGLHVASANCDFAKDETYILRLHAPTGVTRVSADGQQSSSLANLTAAGLNGIAFDTAGTFGHRLLVTAGANGKTQILAIDCAGGVQTITDTAPVVEGGIALAPMSFGIYGGTLIAPDELSGTIWSIGPDGAAHKVVDSGLAHGGDIGVESVGFVPPGFGRGGGYLYYSDRATPNNPHPGTDHVLRISSADLVGAGVKDGDLLAATEGGASMIDVRCDTSCSVTTIVGTPTTAHGEGHLVFTLKHAPTPSPSPRVTATPTSSTAGLSHPVSPAVWIALAAGVLAAVVAAAGLRRRRR